MPRTAVERICADATRVFFELLPAIAIFLLDAGVRVWC